MNLAMKWIQATEAQLNRNNLMEEEERAIILFFELASNEPAKAIDIALQVIERGPHSNIINCLGAGPIEELLVKHPSYLDQLIVLAGKNEKIKQCLKHVDLAENDVIGLRRLADFLEKKPE